MKRGVLRQGRDLRECITLVRRDALGHEPPRIVRVLFASDGVARCAIERARRVACPEVRS